ncbi:MAG: S9 family peptidase, partial [Bacteroidota bacterium]|nr:S9 family peptidase [Bacteroidota bacterium]
MRKSIRAAVLFWAVCMTVFVYGQDAVSYQTPPKEIADLLLAQPTPLVSMNSKASWLLLSERNSYPTVEELGQPENRIAGLRINPNNYAPSRQNFISNFRLKNLQDGKEFPVTGLPATLL